MADQIKGTLIFAFADWNKASKLQYDKVVKHIYKFAGAAFYHMIRLLSEHLWPDDKQNINLCKLMLKAQFIGHSLGAHLWAVFAELMICTIGSMIGLDPTGRGLDPNKDITLNYQCAMLVVSISTDCGGFGDDYLAYHYVYSINGGHILLPHSQLRGSPVTKYNSIDHAYTMYYLYYYWGMNDIQRGTQHAFYSTTNEEFDPTTCKKGERDIPVVSSSGSPTCFFFPVVLHPAHEVTVPGHKATAVFPKLLYVHHRPKDPKHYFPTTKVPACTYTEKKKDEKWLRAWYAHPHIHTPPPPPPPTSSTPLIPLPGL